MRAGHGIEASGFDLAALSLDAGCAVMARISFARPFDVIFSFASMATHAKHPQVGQRTIASLPAGDEMMVFRPPIPKWLSAFLAPALASLISGPLGFDAELIALHAESIVRDISLLLREVNVSIISRAA